MARDILGELDPQVQHALSWLSLMPISGSVIPPIPLPTDAAAPIDLFAQLLSRRLAYQPHERDLVLLHHAFKVAPSSHSDARSAAEDAAALEQTVTASLVCYGTPQASAMATTVGKTLAFAALRVLDGEVKGRGVKGPYEREVWEGVLGRLEEVGLRGEEKWG